MTVSDALEKMYEVVGAAKERLEGNGFEMNVQTTFYDATLATLPDENKARYATVSLIVNKVGGKEGEEYCLSLGLAILKGHANAKRLVGDIAVFERFVDETVETLAEYEDKNEGFDFLTKKAAEDYEEYMIKKQEIEAKNNKMSKIINTVFIVALILFLILTTRR